MVGSFDNYEKLVSLRGQTSPSTPECLKHLLTTFLPARITQITIKHEYYDNQLHKEPIITNEFTAPTPPLRISVLHYDSKKYPWNIMGAPRHIQRFCSSRLEYKQRHWGSGCTKRHCWSAYTAVKASLSARITLKQDK